MLDGPRVIIDSICVARGTTPLSTCTYGLSTCIYGQSTCKARALLVMVGCSYFIIFVFCSKVNVISEQML